MNQKGKNVERCGDFKEALAAIAPTLGLADKSVFYGKGSKHPGYNELGIPESLEKFCADILPASPFIDPRGKPISIIKTNFPKLAGLQHATLPKEEFCASEIIQCIEARTFQLGDYDPGRDDRCRTLFWLPDLLCNPDAIYKNAHKIVAGHEVYVKVYDKMGSTVKLAFTLDLQKDGKVIRTVPVTSFLTDAATACSYVNGNPRYRRK